MSGTITVDKRSLETIPAGQRTEGPYERRFDPALITDASTNCTGCGSAGCHTGSFLPDEGVNGCPMENNIPEINKAFEQGAKAEAQGNPQDADRHYKQAFDISWRTNRWGLLTGSLCPADKLCEGGCIYQGTKQGSILIRGIEREVHRKAWESGWVPPLEQKRSLGKSIAIVGSGFAAISAAEIAFEEGYDVTIVERSPVAGGLGALGIPRLKMAYADMANYTNRLKEAGVIIQTGVTVGAETFGNTVAFDQLAQDHDAVIVATGKYKPKDPVTSENGAENLTQAIHYLTRQSLKNLVDLGIADKTVLDGYDDNLDAKGKKVLVIGGGDTAMDGVRTATTIQNHGAVSATCLYRGTQEKLRAGKKEIEAAREEGVNFEFGAAPETIRKNEDNSLTVVCKNGVEFTGDMVVSAVGFDPENLPALFGTDALPTNKWGMLDVTEPVFIPNTDMFGPEAGIAQAGLVGVYKTASGKETLIAAAGDITGSSLAVHALAGGRDIVPKIHEVLSSRNNNHGLQVRHLNFG